MKIKKVNEFNENKPKPEDIPEIIEGLRELSIMAKGAYNSVDKYRDNTSLEKLDEIRNNLQAHLYPMDKYSDLVKQNVTMSYEEFEKIIYAFYALKRVNEDMDIESYPGMRDIISDLEAIVSKYKK